MSCSELLATARAAPGLAGLAPDDLAALAETAEQVEFQPGQKLMEEGEPGTAPSS
jgi:CRP-like cAMP-binding protein